MGQRRCLSVAGKRIDETIAAEILRPVAPMAIEAAEEADRMLRDEDQDRRRIAELVATWAGFGYVAFVIDAYARRIREEKAQS